MDFDQHERLRNAALNRFYSQLLQSVVQRETVASTQREFEIQQLERIWNIPENGPLNHE